MELIFRTVNPNHPSDIDGFNLLMDDLTRRAQDQELLRRNIDEANGNPDKHLMVAEDAATGTLVGSLLGICFGDFCEACAPVMVIENVVTRHDFRGRGIAKAMFAEIEAWGRSKHAAYAILCSANHRYEAHKFYKAIGYDEVKGFKKYL
jgi:GNAT superfamily N-acetyltransferase